MAGPAASVLVSLPSPAPTWREILSPFASAWGDGDFCYIGDTRPHRGTYAGEPRPLVGTLGTFGHAPEMGLHSACEIEAVELAASRAFTHSVGLAAMCNQPTDHRILGEVVAAIAEQFDGVVNFDSIDAPLEELGMKKCCWEEDGAEHWTVLGDARSARLWLHHPSFHMLK